MEIYSHPVRSGLAYDLVPTTDVFERDQELLRVPVSPLEGEMNELCLSIPIKPLQDYAKKRVKRKADDKDIRLHLYLWLSKWMTWHPDLTYFSVDSHGKGQWTKDDQVTKRRNVIVSIDSLSLLGIGQARLSTH